MENWHVLLILLGVQVGFGLIISAMAFFMKRTIVQIDKRLENGDSRFKEISGFLGEINEKRALDREYFANRYVAKDDFVREIQALDFKIDLVASDVKKLLVLSGRGRDDAIL